MQTFLPFVDFQHSAESLDKKRAWKQVVEASQILDILDGTLSAKWQNHPAVLMWVGHQNYLTYYYNIFWMHCVKYHNIQARKLQLRSFHNGLENRPIWLGNPTFHQSHRDRLAQKAIADLDIGKPNLYNALLDAGIVPKQQNLQGSYYWPVTKDKSNG